MDQNIILLGPCGVGKSTVGKTLSKSLHLPFVDLDKERDRLYKETDYSDSAALKALENR